MSTDDPNNDAEVGLSEATEDEEEEFLELDEELASPPSVVEPPSSGPPPRASGPLQPPPSASGPLQPPSASGPLQPPSASGPLQPPLHASGPLQPPPNMSGPLQPPPNMSGPLQPPPNMSGPLRPPPNMSGPLRPPPNISGPISVPPLGASGALPSVPLNPTGTYGAIANIGSQAKAETAEPVKAWSTSTALGAVVVAGVVGFVLVAGLIVEHWVSTAQAIGWMAVGTLFPTLLAGLFFTWNGSASVRAIALRAVLPSLALSTGAVMLASSWAHPSIRVAAVPWVDLTPEVMSTVLADTSTEVVVAGCERFASTVDHPDYRVRWLSILTIRPEAVTECLATLPAEAQTGLAVSLSERWMRALVATEDNSDAEQACATASALRALPLERDLLTAQLFQCNLDASSDAVRGCCGTALAATVVNEKQAAQYLQDAAPRLVNPSTATGAYKMAFAPSQLSTAQAALRSAFYFDKPSMQRVAFDIACGSVADGDLRVTQFMLASLESCNLDSTKVPRTRAVWSNICTMSQIELDADRTKPVQDVMCDIAQESLLIDAIDTASNLVALALRKDIDQTIARNIDAGYLQMLVDSVTSREETPSFINHDDRRNLAMQGVNPGADIAAGKFSGADDPSFKEFIKAYRNHTEWRNTQPSFRKKRDQQK